MSSLFLPCGRCMGCRLERSRQWALRCEHERKLHKDSCFVTLTYDDEHLPRDGSLNYRHFQLFCKRLRKKFGPFRFFMCGEYGDNTGRPHYHALLFGLDFRDKKPIGKDLYESRDLSRAWSLGFASVGAATFESAAYVARYSLKKVNGDLAKDHYSRVDLETGEVYQIVPEFARMSNRPGIGAGWFHKYRECTYPRDYVISRGKKCKPPRYYDKLLERVDSDCFDVVSCRRAVDGYAQRWNQTDERLVIRYTVAAARQSMQKVRGL